MLRGPSAWEASETTIWIERKDEDLFGLIQCAGFCAETGALSGRERPPQFYRFNYLCVKLWPQ